MRRPGSSVRSLGGWLGRVAACVAVACGCLVVVPWPGWADEPPTPSPNPLELQVDRLEQASRANVTGDRASAMLFNGPDQAALSRAEKEHEARRAAEVGRLFVTKAGRLLPVEPATGLFVPASYHPATTTRTTSSSGGGQTGGLAGAGGLVGLAGGGLLVGAGIVCSVRAGRGEAFDA